MTSRLLVRRIWWFVANIAYRVYDHWLRLIGYPEALVKAVHDQFDYAAGVRGLGIVRFELARPMGLRWLHLDLYPGHGPVVDPPIQQFCFARGIDVRLRDIVWVADAPMDS